ncbi:hypothetical protein [Pseudomonas cavernae]|uniref:hypothetical protein n=1 Tax=Pseudomonas cavernae TaxID=2320867 RepID=UPI0013C44F91|nr:hypothetical protein [Pseudomonas cavernae]
MLASLGAATGSLNSITEAAGISVPDARPGGDHRQWPPEDQANAERAYAAFQGKELDGLETYDPLKPGEAARYEARIKALTAKYAGRTTLTPDEMLEVSKTVVPVLRYLTRSEQYREAKKKQTKVTRSVNGPVHPFPIRKQRESRHGRPVESQTQRSRRRLRWRPVRRRHRRWPV